MAANDPKNDPKDALRRLLDLGSAITGMRREDVEGFLRDLVAGEGERRERAEELAEELFARSRRSFERISSLVRDELARELKSRGSRLSDPAQVLEKTISVVGDLLGTRWRGFPGGPERTPTTTEPGPEDRGETVETAARVVPPASEHVAGAGLDVTAAAPAKKAAAKKAPAKKAAAEKVPAKKAAAKKAPAKKAPAKKAAGAATAPAGEPTAKKAAAEKVPARKIPATKAPANKAPAVGRASRRAGGPGGASAPRS